MFREYDPSKKKMLQILDESGKVTNSKFMPKISDDELIKAYKLMLHARTLDLLIVSYQRQGRMYTYPPNIWQEAVATGTGIVLRDIDWLVPSYRELAAYLHKGATPLDIYLYWGGREEGSKLPGAKNMLPINVPIGSQTLHGAGIAYGLKYKKQDGVVFVYLGDGGTSQGDFHEALNFSAVWKAPVVYIVQNNQYAISMPVTDQTASESIAIKSVAYGIQGIQVDGNDFFACYAAAKRAVEHAETTGPVLIEAVTYRLGAHTTADDPTRYRTKDEEQQWESKDPLARLRKYLASKKLWNEKQEQKWAAEYEAECEKQFLQFEEMAPHYELDDVFQYLYHEMPADLKRQKAQYQDFLKWKESAK